MRTKQILCPLDVFEASEGSVLDYAVGIAEKLGASVDVLHVIQFSGDIHHPTSIELELEEAGRKLDAVLAASRGRKTTVTGDLRPGAPHREIVEAIDRLDVDLVVMGTHAREGMRRFFLGSVAERVVRTSSVPVLTVPFAKGPLHIAPTSILVAHDFSERSGRALEWANGLGKKLGAEIGVMHVLPRDRGGGSDAPASDHERDRERHVESVERELVRAVEEVFGSDSPSVTSRTVEGEIVEEIRAAQHDLGADLIVLGASGKGGVERVLLGSVATAILRTSTVPVLTVP